MKLPTLAATLMLSLLAAAACDWPAVRAERHVRRTFAVAAGTTLEVAIAGGQVTTVTGPSGSVSVEVTVRVRGIGSERSATALVAGYSIDVSQQDGVVRVRADEPRARTPHGIRSREIVATITAPADVTLKIDTRGGSLRVRGDRTADLSADTRGGRLDVDSARGRLRLTSGGGRIRVRRALGTISADARGGSIDVDYVAPSATDISLGASGGSIKVGVDPRAPLTLTTATRGGGIRVDGLPFDATVSEPSQVEGRLNGGGGGWLRAYSRSGAITVRAASDPG